jgi:hypothetical protein
MITGVLEYADFPTVWKLVRFAISIGGVAARHTESIKFINVFCTRSIAAVYQVSLDLLIINDFKTVGFKIRQIE